MMMDPIEVEVRQATLELELCRAREEAVRTTGDRNTVYEARLAVVRASGTLEGLLMMQAVRRYYLRKQPDRN